MARPRAGHRGSCDEMADDEFSFLDPTLLTFPNGAQGGVEPERHRRRQRGAGGIESRWPVAGGRRRRARGVARGRGGDGQWPRHARPGATRHPVVGDLGGGLPAHRPTTESFTGSSTTSDVETMLQVIAMYLTQPRFDQVALDQTIESWRPYVDDPVQRPRHRGVRGLQRASLRRRAALRRGAHDAELDGARPGRPSNRSGGERFSSPGDWVFAFSGDFDVDEMTELVRRYIGSLPDDGRPPRRRSTCSHPRPMA